MSTLTWQMPNYLSFIYRLAPIDTGRLGLEAENPSFWPPGTTKNRLHCPQAGASELCYRPADGFVGQI